MRTDLRTIAASAARQRTGLLVGLLLACMAALAADAFLDIDMATGSPEPAIGEAVTSTSFSGVPDQEPVSLASELPAHDARIGKIAGSGGVSGGAATYAIPIVVPPGRRGMQPNLALSYSSRGGNAVAGMGWSLSGLSAISRCAATLDQDATIRPVALDSGDKLCLDGQRLVATSGAYGQSGTTYATEIESFARVTQLGGALTSGTTYFKLEAKSGEISYYGGPTAAANAARVFPGGAGVPMSWLLERRQDRVGNFVHNIYVDHGDGETLLAAVLYTGFGSADGDRRVEFTYETRPTGGSANDQASSYQAGGLTRQTQRLAMIQTRVGNQPVREYRLTYQLSGASGRSLLYSVTECAYSTAAAVCRPPTNFAWQAAPAHFELHVEPIAQSIGSQPSYGFNSSADEPLAGMLPDFNGDGIREVLWSGPSKSDPSVKEDWLLSTRSDRTTAWAMKLPGPTVMDLRISSVAADFDLDGRADIIQIGPAGNLQVRLWHGPANAQDANQAFNETWETGVAATPIMSLADMDGDGRADLTMLRTSLSDCTSSLAIYGNRPSTAGATFTQIATVALAGIRNSGYCYFEQFEKVSDFDGDGLPDIWIKSNVLTGSKPTRIMFGARSGATYMLTAAPYASIFSGGMTTAESSPGLFSLWADVNGDGLDDFLYADGTGNQGRWALRLNTGEQAGGLGPRMLLSNNGLERGHCGNASCVQWAPYFASKITTGDTDGDGRAEILIPRAFASRICKLQVQDGTTCPNGECDIFYVCPLNPDPTDTTDGILNPNGIGQNAFATGVTFKVDGGLVSPRKFRWASGGELGDTDASRYHMNALRLVETDSGQFELREFETGIVGVPDEDMYGDGLVDAVTTFGCDTTQFGVRACAQPWAGPNGRFPESASPSALPNGLSLFTRQLLISENQGSGGNRNPDGRTPQMMDMLSMATDGLGNQTIWTYYPLSSQAGRAPGDMPLYTVPASADDRYIDDRHFYFTSTMPVVSEMIQSDGLGDYRSWRYGYAEAMFNARGRGFQGFRTIIEEDEAAGTRTTTTFHQKFPLTSQPDQILVTSLRRKDQVAPVSKQVYTWRCNRANRSDANACAPTPTATVKYPFLDSQETWTFDAAVADDPSKAPTPWLAYRKQVAADDATCTGAFASTSGYDQYGNLAATTTLQYDGGGTGGYRKFVASQCERTRTSFVAADTSGWWLDRMASRTVTTAISYNAAVHALPAGVTAPAQTVTTTYTWNSDRTPASETLQPGVQNQQRTTIYGYPTTSNYGDPSSVSVTASGDPNGARVVSTTYSPDGYFPLVVTNPLGHKTTTLTRSADGLPSQVTDPNGLRTLTDYDAFGFATRVRYRGVTDGEYVAPDKLAALTWCPATTCPSPTSTKRIRLAVVQDGSPTQYTHSDALGRTVSVATRLADATWSWTATQYDQLGHVTAQTEPYRSGDPIYWTRYPAYDLVGRVLQKVQPKPNQDGRGDLVTSYTYVGRTTSIHVCGSLDPDASRCLDLSRTTDGSGRYVETVDAMDGVTRYWYEPAGNALAIQDANGNVTSATYNAIGQRVQVDDPNQGVWNFAYDAVGDVLRQTDARGITTATSYDKLGRPAQRSATYDYEGDGALDTIVDSWSYDPTYAIGALAGIIRKFNGTTLRTETFGYDMLSRAASRTVSQQRMSGAMIGLTQQTAYDSYYGRAKARSYGNGEALWLRYSKYGHLTHESNANGGEDYRVVTQVDARGNSIQETLSGGRIMASRGYLKQTGQASLAEYGSMGSSTLRRIDYRYDVFGNLARQSLNGNQAAESYKYDALHRLVEATRAGVPEVHSTYTYDAIGNFTSKSDFSTPVVGAYEYGQGSCGGGPSAVKSVSLQAGGNKSYCYDAAGNMISDGSGLSAKYDHTQRPIRILRGTAQQNFDYGTNGDRFRKVEAGGETHYFGEVERNLAAATDTTYLGASTIIIRSGANRRVKYLLLDRLGSVDSVVDEDGVIQESRGYDAFGKPRSGDWTDRIPAKLGFTALTDKGFTGHRHLDQLELIHMQGRVYDYNLGRFLEVDAFIQNPINSQSINPYSYILNNPLSGVDPTGFRSCDDVSVSEKGSGTCTFTSDNGKETDVSYRVGEKNWSITMSGAAFVSIARENSAAARNGAMGGTGSGMQTVRSPLIGNGTASSTRLSISIGPVPGFPEAGQNSWRAENDAAFFEAVNAYNEKYGLGPGDAGYWTAARLKAQAMIESGSASTRRAFLTDPLQVNVSGDWDPAKARLLGLEKGQSMTPEVSAQAALEWLRYKGFRHDQKGLETSYRGDFDALRRYNGNIKEYKWHPGVEHRDWYADAILALEEEMNP